MDEQRKTINMMLKKVLQQEKVIAPEKSLVDDLGIDSLGMFELTGAIEEEFDVLMPVSKVYHIKTVADLYRAVESIDEYAINAAKTG